MLDSTRTPFITTQYGQYAVAARALGTVREGGKSFPAVREYTMAARALGTVREGRGGYPAVRAVRGGSTRTGHGEKRGGVPTASWS